jgi:hypothetical protein
MAASAPRDRARIADSCHVGGATMRALADVVQFDEDYSAWFIALSEMLEKEAALLRAPAPPPVAAPRLHLVPVA